ncbi:MAG TPA: hypothetical protein VGK61_05875 [Planctomycetota bacterium]
MELRKLAIEELEARIAPSGFGPSDNGNAGNEVSNGTSPEPSGGGGGGESNGNAGNEVSNGSSPEPQ